MGLLIAIEGDDYVGKTSVAVPGLKAVLTDCGLPVLVSREPGGSPQAEAIRQEIFTKAHTQASQEELATLFNKARNIHLEQVIKPFLGEHKEKQGIVILDRYLDSTRVYQGLEGKLPMEKIYELEKEFVEDYFPDITFVLYFPLEKLEKILRVRQEMAHDTAEDNRDRTTWDTSSLEVHRKRQQYYFQLADIAKSQGEKRIFHFIDASESPFNIIQQLVINTGNYLPHSQTAMSNSLKTLKNSLFFMHLERQWKKQQHLLTKIV